MTIKERACNLINSLPDDRVYNVINYIHSSAIEEEMPDEFDMELLKIANEAKKRNDFVALDDILEELEFEHNGL